MMQNNTHSSPNRRLEVLLKLAHILVLICHRWTDPCSTHVGAVC